MQVLLYFLNSFSLTRSWQSITTNPNGILVKSSQWQDCSHSSKQSTVSQLIILENIIAISKELNEKQLAIQLKLPNRGISTFWIIWSYKHNVWPKGTSYSNVRYSGTSSEIGCCKPSRQKLFRQEKVRKTWNFYPFRLRIAEEEVWCAYCSL